MKLQPEIPENGEHLISSGFDIYRLKRLIVNIKLKNTRVNQWPYLFGKICAISLKILRTNVICFYDSRSHSPIKFEDF